ncbi:MAG: hypothetical protein PWR26_1435 [Methanosarcinales archaeon]|uniref:2TM domain-containing protein n=1 Tax=Methermicoccus shengliensis TaxID=660064 RepID=UPI00076BED54|nr:2TM domain-containing protein [Methermicoccus shengliensis]KUK03917.1 MAG: hypothetical protein XD46_1353 [Euryarchaeota archaeon 55_53]MDI3488718.1 hypothetical protein [Methanosarcinales archaeon]MDN5295638.1 hypothetical protein [Methanosarcinales archaeon]
MAEEISLEDYKRAYREMKTEEARRGFLAHLAVYVLVNTILILVNLLYSPHVMWFFYPLLGWGIGITAHYLNGIRWIEGTLKEDEAKAEYRAREIWYRRVEGKINPRNVAKYSAQEQNTHTSGLSAGSGCWLYLQSST